MVLALMVSVILVLLGFSILTNGLAFGERHSMDMIALVVVFILGILVLIQSVFNQLAENGTQQYHFLPCACMMLGLAALDYGILPGFTAMQSQAIAIMLAGAGLLGYVGGSSNSLLMVLEFCVFALSVIAKGATNLVFLKASVLVFFAVGLVLGNVRKTSISQLICGAILAALFALTFWKSESLFVWTALLGAVFAWISNRKALKDSQPEKEKAEHVVIDSSAGSKMHVAPMKETAASEASTPSETKTVDDLPVEPQVLPWMQSFVNAASILDLRDTRLYAYDAKSSKYYRFNQLTGKLGLCAGGLYPDLLSLVDKNDKHQYMGFLNKALEGKFDENFHCRIWDDSKLEFYDYSIKASVLDTEGPVLVLFATLIDSYVSNYRKEVAMLEDRLDDSKRQYTEALVESRRIFYSCNELLNSFIERKSEESYSHINAVCKISEILLKKARSMYPDIEMSDEMIANIKDATVLHDVGKIMISDDILKKQGSLTPEEFEEMKKHTLYGADIINRMPFVRGEEQTMKYALEIALHHHERVDGKGYPDGLAGDKIPLYVQIVSLADVYEALTARRVYKVPVSHDNAIEMIVNGECGAFSQKILDCLEKSKDDLARIRTELRY